MQEQRYDHPHIVTIEDVIQETPTVRTLIFTDNIMSCAEPGQFAMVWVPGAYELPMSIMISKGSSKAAFTVRRHGSASTALFNVSQGEQIGIRGPYGNYFQLSDVTNEKKRQRILMVGGGTGLVPLMRLLSHIEPNTDVTFLIGATTKEEVFFVDMAMDVINDHNAIGRVVVATDDGTMGKKGRVGDIARMMISGIDNNTNTPAFDAVYTCGPELMMYTVVSAACDYDTFVQASLERLMKCGVGICGSCCAGKDIVCMDGTIFDGNHLMKNQEFGHSRLSKAGISEFV